MAQEPRKSTDPKASSPKAKPRRAGRWRNGPVPVIGLIGGIGAGKTLVGSLFAERGAIVVEADKVGHSLMDQRPARDKIIQRFGSRVLDLNQSTEPQPPIDRKALGQLVFDDAVARKDLEAILHPAMRKTFEKVIDRAGRQARTTAVVIDAAILYEAGWNQLCDVVVFIDSPRDQRLARLAASRGWTAEVLDSREKAQLPLEDKKRRADQVITNDSDTAALQASVDAWWAKKIPAGRSGQGKNAPGPSTAPTRPKPKIKSSAPTNEPLEEG